MALIRRVERTHGRFYRSFLLPQAADADEIEATHDNGVLSLHIPKMPERQPRRIEVRTPRKSRTAKKSK